MASKSDWVSEVVVDGLAFPEGPVYHGPDELSVVEIQGGCVSRIRAGAIEARWETGGGPNGATAGADGSLYIANNGGMRVGEKGPERADDGVTGRIQRITPEGRVEQLAVELPGRGPHSPNDICFGPDGLLYFTDPRWAEVGPDNPGALHRVDLKGAVERIADVARFPNGLAFGTDGRLYVAESVAKRVLVYDWSPAGLGSPETFCEIPKGFPDGFCFDADRDLIVCGSMEDTICLFDREGRAIDRFDTPEGAHPTNCCIGGGFLWVTYSGFGQLVRFHYDAEPQPLLTESGG